MHAVVGKKEKQGIQKQNSYLQGKCPYLTLHPGWGKSIHTFANYIMCSSGPDTSDVLSHITIRVPISAFTVSNLPFLLASITNQWLKKVQLLASLVPLVSTIPVQHQREPLWALQNQFMWYWKRETNYIRKGHKATAYERKLGAAHEVSLDVFMCHMQILLLLQTQMEIIQWYSVTVTWMNE